MTNDRKSKLEKIIADARDELYEMRDAEDDKRNKKLVGKYFKYQNRYSTDDWWWLYGKVVGVGDGSINMVQFQTDCRGKIDIEPENKWRNNIEGWVEITKEEFDSQWKSVMTLLGKLND